MILKTDRGKNYNVQFADLYPVTRSIQMSVITNERLPVVCADLDKVHRFEAFDPDSGLLWACEGCSKILSVSDLDDRYIVTIDLDGDD